MNILSLNIKSKHTKPGGEGLPYLKGLVGEWVEAIIDFETKRPHDEIVFEIELGLNSKTAYTYTDPLGGYAQIYKGKLNEWFTPQPPKCWDFGAVKHESLSGNKYRLRHFFFINPLPLKGIRPEVFEDDEGMRYVFALALNYKNERKKRIESTKFYTPGKVGYLGEKYDKSRGDFSLKKAVNLDLSANYLEFVINTTSSIPTNCRLSLHASGFIFNRNKTQNLIYNYKYAYAYGFADEKVFSGFNLRDCVVKKIDSKQLNIKLKINEENFTNKSFVLWAVIGDYTENEADSQREAVLLHLFDQKDTVKPPPPHKPLLWLQKAAGADHKGIAFFYHENPAKGYSDVKAAVMDGVLAKAKLGISPGCRLHKVVVSIESEGQIFEQRAFLTTTNTSKNYILAPNDEFNAVNFDFNTGELSYAFRIRWESWREIVSKKHSQEWAKQPKIFFSVAVVFFEGNIKRNIKFVSPDFKIFDYNESTAGKNGALVNRVKIETKNAKTGKNLGGNIDEIDDTEITATFSGANNKGLGLPKNALYGIISIDQEPLGGVNFVRTLSSTRQNAEGVFAENRAILTDYNLKNTNAGGFGKVVLKATLKPRRIKGQNIIIAARLGQKQGQDGGKAKGYRPINPLCLQAPAATAWRPKDPFCVQKKRFKAFRPKDPFCFKEGEKPPKNTGWRPISPYCLSCPPYGKFDRLLCLEGAFYNRFHDGNCGYFIDEIDCDIPTKISVETSNGKDIPQQLVAGLQFCDALKTEIVMKDGKEYLKLCEKDKKPFFKVFKIENINETTEVGEAISAARRQFVFDIEHPNNVLENTLSVVDVSNNNTVLAKDKPVTSPIELPVPRLHYVQDKAVHIFLISAKDTAGRTFTKQLRLRWLLRMYWGTANNTVLNEQQIKQLSHSALAGDQKLIHHFAGGGFKFWAYPKSWGFSKLFNHLGPHFPTAMATAREGYAGNNTAGTLTISVQNNFGVLEEYLLYRTKNTLASAVTLEIG